MPEWLLFLAVIYFATRLAGGSCCAWGGRGRRLGRGTETGEEALSGKRRSRHVLTAGSGGAEDPGQQGGSVVADGGAAGRSRRAARAADRRHRSDRSPAPPKPESPLEALQRRFVDGVISVEEYERELDRLYRTKPHARV